VLIEAAWAYRHPAKVSLHIQQRIDHLPKPLQDLGWKAQVRLCKRFRRLVARERIIDCVLPDGFQRDGPPEARIDGVVDQTHSTFTEQADHTKRADPFGHGCHNGRDSTAR
jgi:hypothetical protein